MFSTRTQLGVAVCSRDRATRSARFRKPVLPLVLRAAGIDDRAPRHPGERRPRPRRHARDGRRQFRVELLPSYKTHRVAESEAEDGAEEVPDTLTPQVPIILDLLE